MSFRTGGNSSTAIVIACDRFLACCAAPATVTSEPMTTTLTASAIAARLLTLIDLADIGGPQLRPDHDRRRAATCGWWSRPVCTLPTQNGARPSILEGDGSRASVEAEREQHGREEEDHARDDGEAVEVPLDDGGTGHGTAQRTAAEHVGEAAAAPGVQQDQ